MYNGTGDVTTLVRIRTQAGTTTTETNVVAAEYTYSPYGEIVAVTGSDEIKDINPIRYKGYYYDTDTGWYNLKTRYYDPMVGRFINADDVSLLTESEEDLTDKNLYAYCDNNPINRSDDEGEIWGIVAGAFGGALIGAAISIGKQVHSGKKLSEISWKKVGKSALSGALIGASVGSGVGAVAKLATKGVTKVATKTLARSAGKNYKIKPPQVSGYTKHGLKQALTRNGHGVKPSAIRYTLKNGRPKFGKDPLGRYGFRYQTRRSRVVVNTKGKIVTVIGFSSKYWRIK